MSTRALYEPDHEAYRETVREFLAREVVPHMDRWDDARLIDRDVYRRAAQTGMYALAVPEAFGGAGEPDFRFRQVVCEEIGRISALSFGLTLCLQDDLVLAYLTDITDDDQRRRWLPGFASGELIGALAVTEPGTGSDLRGIRTTARRDGDHWVVNGQKTFISSGTTADLVVLATRTGDDGPSAYTLLVVEADTPGFVRGRQLDKIGLLGQDTAELFFDNARVPAANMLGEEGKGLRYLMSHLPRERLGIAAMAVGSARGIFETTLAYCKERTAFGQRIADFQNTRFELATLATHLDAAEAYLDTCALAYNAGNLSATDAAKAKWWLTEFQKDLVDRCLQLHGGYGFMREFPVAKAYVDSRIQTIYGGTTEIMKELIGRELVRP